MPATPKPAQTIPATPRTVLEELGKIIRSYVESEEVGQQSRKA